MKVAIERLKAIIEVRWWEGLKARFKRVLMVREEAVSLYMCAERPADFPGLFMFALGDTRTVNIARSQL